MEIWYRIESSDRYRARIMGKIITVASRRGGRQDNNYETWAPVWRYCEKALVITSSQGNTTSGLGVNKINISRCIYDCLINGTLCQRSRPPRSRGSIWSLQP